MAETSVGEPISRVESFERVTGRTIYTAERHPKGRLHTVLIQSDAPAGRIVAVHDTAAQKAPGVRLVLTHQTCPS